MCTSQSTADQYPVFSSFMRGGPNEHFRRSEVAMKEVCKVAPFKTGSDEKAKQRNFEIWKS